MMNDLVIEFFCHVAKHSGVETSSYEPGIF